VKCESFRNFLTYVNPLAGIILPKSASIINKWVENQVSLNEPRICQILRSAVSKIHVMCDLWDAGFHKHVIGIIFVFVLPSGERVEILAGLKRVKGRY
jgi:hypothetical protein